MTLTTERQQFEQWWETAMHNGYPPRFGWEHWRDGGGYRDDDGEFQGLWQAWQASRGFLANREAQPVALVDRRPAASGSICWQNGGKDLPHGTELFTAPPAPAVPDEVMPGGLVYSSALPAFESNDNNKVVGYSCFISGDTRIVESQEQAYADAKAVINACRAAMLAQPVSSGYKLPGGWIACSERMPEVGERDWRTALPVLVKCEIGVIPAYYGFTYHEGEQCFGFMESIKFGDGSVSGPEQHENRLMMHVTHWMPLPAAPEGGNG